MKTNTALLAMGLFAIAGANTISCGGSSDDGTLFTAGTAGNSAGTTATAGTTAAAGTTSTGGATSGNAGSNNGIAGSSNNTAGTNNNTAGSNNTAGTNNNTAGSSNSTAGASNGNGGRSDPGNGGAPDPGTGGAGADGCPATMPADGATCMQGDSSFEGCDYGDMNCRCRRANGGQMRAWRCEVEQGADAVCPADAMDGDPCTGQGLCAGQQCYCNNEETSCF